MTPNLAVARRSPSPSGGAREQARDGASPIGPVILATEFGAVSVGAERVAVRMARDAGVSLVVVHAIDVGRLRLPGGRFRQRVDQARAAREHDAEAMLRRVETAGFRPQVLIWEGDPASCVLDAARAEGASRIVVGSHGRGRLGRALVGSVSAVIANRPIDRSTSCAAMTVARTSSPSRRAGRRDHPAGLRRLTGFGRDPGHGIPTTIPG